MVQIVGLEDILAAHPFTAGLDRDTVQTIADRCGTAVCHPGADTVRQGESASNFRLIRRREVPPEISVPAGTVDVTVVTSTIGLGPLYAIRGF
jgi:hypothetical protein